MCIRYSPYLWNQIIQVNNLKMMINYGMDKMKFGQAVLSGPSIRLVDVYKRQLDYNKNRRFDNRLSQWYTNETLNSSGTFQIAQPKMCIRDSS